MAENLQQKPQDIIDRREFRKRYREFMKDNIHHMNRVMDLNREGKISLGALIETNAEQYANNIAIKFKDTQLTYKEFNQVVNQYAHYFLSLGLKKGDIIDILMKNCIEYIILVIAVGKIGAIGSLINYDLREKSLTHCLKHTLGKVIIVDQECFEGFESIKDDLKLSDQKLCFLKETNSMSCPKGYIDLSSAVSKFPVTNPPTVADVKLDDPWVYIFTSGTTGLPKAAIFPHQRVISTGIYFGQMLGQLNSDDTVYVSTPLFHSISLAVGMGSAFTVGGALAFAQKFSASRFWDEIRKYNATVFIYLGEICRYLLKQPVKSNDAENSVKTIIGGGLRPEIWKEFKSRFGIERVGEFYSSTEAFGGFANLLNFDCTCGYNPQAYAIVKYDVEEDIAVRDENGFMQKVRLGETGLLIFPFQSDKSFFGYKDEKATKSKFMRNVFKEGDTWLNSGDLVRDQGCNHVIFVDRVGDTFRWKGHNMSTAEVENIFSSFNQVSLSTVYGIQIPGTDGRAPMAAFVADVDAEKFDFKGLIEYLINNLPPYGVPIFLRLKTKLATTSTHKLQKTVLKKEGINLELIDDALFIKLQHESNYKPFTKEIYIDIQNGKIKF